MKRALVPAMLALAVACIVDPGNYAGRACDADHACLDGRVCVLGACVTGPSDASVTPKDAGPVQAVDAGPPPVFDAGSAKGADCSDDSQCSSGYCVSGVCCADRCAGSCARCDAPRGTCSVRDAGALGVPTCGGFLGCDGRLASCPTNCATVGCIGGRRCDGLNCVPKTADLVDDFNAGLNAALWSTEVTQGASAFVDGGRLILRTPAGLASAALISENSYDLEGSSIEVSVPEPGPAVTNKITKLMLRIDLKNEMAVHFVDGQVFAYLIANGAYTIPGPTYADDGGFARFRMRDDGGTVYFEAGHGGVFQPLGSRLNPFGAVPLRDMKVHLQSFTLIDVDAGGDAVYDNLNVP